jgi:hypothetical protein
MVDGDDSAASASALAFSSVSAFLFASASAALLFASASGRVYSLDRYTGGIYAPAATPG